MMMTMNDEKSDGNEKGGSIFHHLQFKRERNDWMNEDENYIRIFFCHVKSIRLDIRRVFSMFVLCIIRIEWNITLENICTDH